MSEGPTQNIDVVSEVLTATRLTAQVFGRFELSAPWALRVPRAEHIAFYVLARGGAWLDVDEDGPDGLARDVALSAGDVVLLPHGSSHLLRDSARTATEPGILGESECPRPTPVTPLRFGGSGAVTSFLGGAFRFGPGPRNALLRSLPPLLHSAAGEPSMTPQLAAYAQLILAETATPEAGTRIISARLAEILLIHALRALSASRPDGGLLALADPAVGASLQLMHARPAERWTVASLAGAVLQSRSAFAARFTELVGEPPLLYLTHWRMAIAAQLLLNGERSLTTIAHRVGYATPAAFAKAFTRVYGLGPAVYQLASL